MMSKERLELIEQNRGSLGSEKELIAEVRRLQADLASYRAWEDVQTRRGWMIERNLDRLWIVRDETGKWIPQTGISHSAVTQAMHAAVELDRKMKEEGGSNCL